MKDNLLSIGTRRDNFQLVEADTLKSKEASMKHECKITVLETKVFLELQEKYLADPK